VFVLDLTGVLSQWRRAKAGELVARQNAYSADMKEVQRALEDSDLGRARELLNRHRPRRQSQISNLKSQIETDWFWEPAFFPDSKTFLTATEPEGAVARWDAATVLEVERLSFLGTNHTSLGLSRDGRWLALGDAVGNIHLKNLLEAALSPNEQTLAVGYWNGTAAWWDLATVLLFSLAGLPQAIAQPVITKQPTRTAVALGGATPLQDTASAPTPLTFQGQINGADLTGAINNRLTLTHVTLADCASWPTRRLTVSPISPTRPTPVSAATRTSIFGGTALTSAPPPIALSAARCIVS